MGIYLPLLLRGGTQMATVRVLLFLGVDSFLYKGNIKAEGRQLTCPEESPSARLLSYFLQEKVQWAGLGLLSH